VWCPGVTGSATPARIGVVFGQRSGLWWDLPLRDSLRLVGELYEVPRDRYRENLGRFTELLGLTEFLDTPVRQLSLGQRMRGDLAAAMLYEPRILYLDEPTIGLDVVAKERIRSFVAELNQELRTTVILTTHDLDDVERLCSRILLIDHGRVLYDGDVKSLKARHAPYRELMVRLASTVDDISVPGAELARREDGAVWLRFDPERVAPATVVAEVIARYPVSDLSIVEPNLEGVIHHLYADRSA
jgi:ABC-2 type transport system ATP-binding protein